MVLPSFLSQTVINLTFLSQEVLLPNTPMLPVVNPLDAVHQPTQTSLHKKRLWVVRKWSYHTSGQAIYTRRRRAWGLWLFVRSHRSKIFEGELGVFSAIWGLLWLCHHDRRGNEGHAEEKLLGYRLIACCTISCNSLLLLYYDDYLWKQPIVQFLSSIITVIFVSISCLHTLLF